MTDNLSISYPRRFVPADANMGDWAAIEPLFDELDARAIDTPEQLERWLLDQSELAACISEEGSKRYVAMTCQTDDPEREKAHLFFVEQITPKCKPRWHRLRQRYVSAPARAALAGQAAPTRERYRVFDRSAVAAVELFRDANVPLQTDDDKLDQQYQKICGAMTVNYDGREQTLPQMARYLREPDRKVRQEAWELVGSRRLADREAIDEIFDQMISVRDRVARNADLPDFRDYQFKAYERFDYTPADCIAFHNAIEKTIVPAVRRLHGDRKRTLGVDVLRPWDLAVDPHNRPPLKPFTGGAELAEKCIRVFTRLDPILGGQFAAMVQAGWLDLESRKGKAPGGYQATFDETRHPFIFMNAVGLHHDVETLLHEGGHAFHALACRDEPLLAYRHCGMEMAEVASMGMELIAFDLLDEFYSPADLARARREKLEDVLVLFPWIATIDAFQHWLYTHPKHSRGERTETWLAIAGRFGGAEDWTGYEDIRQAAWQRQLHLFTVPFYYIEYGIAQIGALQLWRNSRANKVAALRNYRKALALGGSRPLPELWSAAGLTFDFSESTLAPLIELVQRELETLPK
jgi:oligoendopeptidase F